MSFTLAVDHVRRLVITTFEGEVTGDQLTDVLSSICRDTGGRGALAVMLDYRLVTALVVTDDELRRLFEAMPGYDRCMGAGRTAWVTYPGQYDVHDIHTLLHWKSKGTGGERERQGFVDYGAASNWLAEA